MLSRTNLAADVIVVMSDASQIYTGPRTCSTCHIDQ